MSRIDQLNNIESELIAKLKAVNVFSVEDLWEAIGAKFSKGIKDLEAKGFTRTQLVGVLIEGACPPASKSNRKLHRFMFRIRRHWKEFFAVVIALILIALLLINAGRRQDAVVVVSDSALPAFHVLSPGELAPRRLFNTPGSLTSVNDATGRYLLQPASPGSVLLDSQLGPRELQGLLKGRHILTLSIKAGAISSTIGPAARVRLIFSPRKRDDQMPKPESSAMFSLAGFSITDVIVLTLDRQGDSSSITVAIKNDEDLSKAVSLAATSELLIAE